MAEFPLLRISVRGAGAAASKFSRAARQVQNDVIAELRAIGEDAAAELFAVAPKDTEQLARSLRPSFFFAASRPRVTIKASAQGHGGDPRSYVAISRRGHASARIYPHGHRALKVYIMGHRNPHISIFRSWVTGYGHPHTDLTRAAGRRGGADAIRAVRRAARAHDWVEDAQPAIDRALSRAERSLGRRIESSLR